MTPINYYYLTDAITYYKKLKYQYIDTPWLVNENISNVTKPIDRQNFYIKNKVLVASAEQSFIQLMTENKLKLNKKYQTITPCFRNEPVIDDIHRIGFMKLELIHISKNIKHLNNMCQNALNFYSQFVNCKLIQTDQ